MALSQISNSSLTVSTTELSLISNSSTLQTNTTAAVYQLFLDLSNLAVGDSFLLKIKEAAAPSSNQYIVLQETFSVGGGVFASPIYASPALQLMNGWDMTLTKLYGTDRIIPYSIRIIS
jgi:hypothetical protein